MRRVWHFHCKFVAFKCSVAFMRVMILFCIAHNFNVVYSMAEIHLSCAKEQTSSFSIIHFAIFCALSCLFFSFILFVCCFFSLSTYYWFIFILCPTAFYDLLKSMPNVRRCALWNRIFYYLVLYCQIFASNSELLEFQSFELIKNNLQLFVWNFGLGFYFILFHSHIYMCMDARMTSFRTNRTIRHTRGVDERNIPMTEAKTQFIAIGISG